MAQIAREQRIRCVFTHENVDLPQPSLQPTASWSNKVCVCGGGGGRPQYILPVSCDPPPPPSPYFPTFGEQAICFFCALSVLISYFWVLAIALPRFHFVYSLLARIKA